MPHCDHFDDPGTCKFCAPRDVVVSRLEAEVRRLTLALADSQEAHREIINHMKGLESRLVDLSDWNAKLKALVEDAARVFELNADAPLAESLRRQAAKQKV